MKITELKCTACSGDLKVNEDNPSLAVCEYCQRQYGIEWENEGAAHFKKQTPEYIYIPREPVPEEQTKKTGWEPYGWKRGVALGFLGIALLFGLNYKGIRARYEQDKHAAKAAEVNLSGASTGAASITEGPTAFLFTGGMAEFVETVFEKPQDQITPEELARISELELRYSDGWLLGYRMQDTQELIWVPLTDKSSDFKSVSLLSGLKKLTVNGAITSAMVEGLHLTSLNCIADDVSSITSALEFPGELESLEISSVSALDGIGELTGLSSLTIHAYELEDLSSLAQVKNLKKLELLKCNIATDFSVLTTLTSLEELSIDSDTLKGLGFLKQLPNLTSFSVEDATLINLDGVQELKNLKSLTIDSCEDTQTMNELSQLSGLEHLSLEIPYGCEEPDLTGLSNLKSLHIDHMSNLDFLASMPHLESLSLTACTVNNPAVFSQLTVLKDLTCRHMSGDIENWNFVIQLPGLESLDLTGVATYEDISSLFMIPTLKKLLLNGMECEINFQKLTQNPGLQVLEISGVKLYKNVNIQGGGGIYQINYDDVKLVENMEFLANFPGLTELNLSGNMLTDLTALQSLSQLQSLNIKDNFITDLKPLSGLSALKTLHAEGNPIENYQILSDKVTIIK